jgi:Na+-driven multidrug efflux pump
MAAFGFFLFLWDVCYFIPVMGFQEYLGIKCSEYFSVKKYTHMKTCLKYSFCTVFLMQIFYLSPQFYILIKFIDVLAVGENEVDIEVSKYYKMDYEVSKIAWYLYPCALIQSVNEMLKTYAYCQGIENPFGYFYLFSSLICSPICWVCVVYLKQGVVGFVAYKYVTELMNLVFCVYIYRTKLDKNTNEGLFKDLKWYASLETEKENKIDNNDILELNRKLSDDKSDNVSDLGAVKYSNAETSLTFSSYLIESIKFMMSLYCEFLSFQAGMILCAITQNINQLSAYMAWTNFISFLYQFSFGIAIVLRTRFNYLLGRKEYLTVKNFYVFIFKYTSVLGIILGILLILMRYIIAGIYTNNPIIREYLADMIKVYLFIYFSELLTPTIAMVLKSLGKNTMYFCLNFGIVFLGSVILGILFTWGFKMEALGLVISFIAATTVFT